MQPDEKFFYVTTYDEEGNAIPLPKYQDYPFTITPLLFDRPIWIKNGVAVDVSDLVRAKGTEADGQRPTFDPASFKHDGNGKLAADRPKSADPAPSTNGEKPKWMTEAAKLCQSSTSPPDHSITVTEHPTYQHSIWNPPPGVQNYQTHRRIEHSTTRASPATSGTNKKQNEQKVPKTDPPKAYDLAGELMKQLPMRMLNEALFVYNGKAYEFVSATVMHRLIMAYCRNAVSIVGDASVIKRVYEVIQAEPTICISEVKNLDLVSFENGLLDLLNFTMHPHTPAIFVTAQVQGEFHPELSLTCPVFDRFLDQTTGGDPVLVQRIWEAIGYILTPDTRGKAFILFQGVRDSGKSMLGDFIASLLRQEDVTAIPLEELGERFGASDLVGKRICLSLDLPNALLDTKSAGMLKSLTGGDLVSVDVKYQPRIKFRNTAKFLFATNHRFGTRIPDDALLRRVVTIPFRYSVPVEAQDPALLDKLQAERTAIITKALLAYRDLRARGYRFSGDYPLNGSIEESLVQAPPSKADLEQILIDYIRNSIVPDPGSMVFTEDLHEQMKTMEPAFMSMDVKRFGGLMSNTMELLFPTEMERGIIKKDRKYKPGNSNATSVYLGVEMKKAEGGRNNGFEI